MLNKNKLQSCTACAETGQVTHGKGLCDNMTNFKAITKEGRMNASILKYNLHL